MIKKRRIINFLTTTALLGALSSNIASATTITFRSTVDNASTAVHGDWQVRVGTANEVGANAAAAAAAANYNDFVAALIADDKSISRFLILGGAGDLQNTIVYNLATNSINISRLSYNVDGGNNADTNWLDVLKNTKTFLMAHGNRDSGAAINFAKSILNTSQFVSNKGGGAIDPTGDNANVAPNLSELRDRQIKFAGQIKDIKKQFHLGWGANDKSISFTADSDLFVVDKIVLGTEADGTTVAVPAADSVLKILDLGIAANQNLMFRGAAGTDTKLSTTNYISPNGKIIRYEIQANANNAGVISFVQPNTLYYFNAVAADQVTTGTINSILAKNVNIDLFAIADNKAHARFELVGKDSSLVVSFSGQNATKFRVTANDPAGKASAAATLAADGQSVTFVNKLTDNVGNNRAAFNLSGKDENDNVAIDAVKLGHTAFGIDAVQNNAAKSAEFAKDTVIGISSTVLGVNGANSSIGAINVGVHGNAAGNEHKNGQGSFILVADAGAMAGSNARVNNNNIAQFGGVITRNAGNVAEAAKAFGGNHGVSSFKELQIKSGSFTTALTANAGVAAAAGTVMSGYSNPNKVVFSGDKDKNPVFLLSNVANYSTQIDGYAAAVAGTAEKLPAAVHFTTDNDGIGAIVAQAGVQAGAQAGRVHTFATGTVFGAKGKSLDKIIAAASADANNTSHYTFSENTTDKAIDIYVNQITVDTATDTATKTNNKLVFEFNTDKGTASKDKTVTYNLHGSIGSSDLTAAKHYAYKQLTLSNKTYDDQDKRGSLAVNVHGDVVIGAFTPDAANEYAVFVDNNSSFTQEDGKLLYIGVNPANAANAAKSGILLGSNSNFISKGTKNVLIKTKNIQGNNLVNYAADSNGAAHADSATSVSKFSITGAEEIKLDNSAAAAAYDNINLRGLEGTFELESGKILASTLYVKTNDDATKNQKFNVKLIAGASNQSMLGGIEAGDNTTIDIDGKIKFTSSNLVKASKVNIGANTDISMSTADSASFVTSAGTNDTRVAFAVKGAAKSNDPKTQTWTNLGVINPASDAVNTTSSYEDLADTNKLTQILKNRPNVSVEGYAKFKSLVSNAATAGKFTSINDLSIKGGAVKLELVSDTNTAATDVKLSDIVKKIDFSGTGTNVDLGKASLDAVAKANATALGSIVTDIQAQDKTLTSLALGNVSSAAPAKDTDPLNLTIELKGITANAQAAATQADLDKIISTYGKSIIEKAIFDKLGIQGKDAAGKDIKGLGRDVKVTITSGSLTKDLTVSKNIATIPTAEGSEFYIAHTGGKIGRVDLDNSLELVSANKSVLNTDTNLAFAIADDRAKNLTLKGTLTGNDRKNKLSIKSSGDFAGLANFAEVHIKTNYEKFTNEHLDSNTTYDLADGKKAKFTFAGDISAKTGSVFKGEQNSSYEFVGKLDDTKKASEFSTSGLSDESFTSRLNGHSFTAPTHKFSNIALNEKNTFGADKNGVSVEGENISLGLGHNNKSNFDVLSIEKGLIKVSGNHNMILKTSATLNKVDMSATSGNNYTLKLESEAGTTTPATLALAASSQTTNLILDFSGIKPSFDNHSVVMNSKIDAKNNKILLAAFGKDKAEYVSDYIAKSKIIGNQLFNTYKLEGDAEGKVHLNAVANKTTTQILDALKSIFPKLSDADSKKLLADPAILSAISNYTGELSEDLVKELVSNSEANAKKSTALAAVAPNISSDVAALVESAASASSDSAGIATTIASGELDNGMGLGVSVFGGYFNNTVASVINAKSDDTVNFSGNLGGLKLSLKPNENVSIGIGAAMTGQIEQKIKDVVSSTTSGISMMFLSAGYTGETNSINLVLSGASSGNFKSNIKKPEIKNGKLEESEVIEHDTGAAPKTYGASVSAKIGMPLDLPVKPSLLVGANISMIEEYEEKVYSPDSNIARSNKIEKGYQGGAEAALNFEMQPVESLSLALNVGAKLNSSSERKSQSFMTINGESEANSISDVKISSAENMALKFVVGGRGAIKVNDSLNFVGQFKFSPENSKKESSFSAVIKAQISF